MITSEPRPSQRQARIKRNADPPTSYPQESCMKSWRQAESPMRLAHDGI